LSMRTANVKVLTYVESVGWLFKKLRRKTLRIIVSQL
jgi:hypothetical protein